MRQSPAAITERSTNDQDPLSQLSENQNDHDNESPGQSSTIFQISRPEEQ
jgi:hypothetical protein